MDGPRLTDLCDRLVARLGDRTLTRYQIIDLATVLMLVQWDIDLRDRTAVAALSTPLRWIHDQAQEASVHELRSHVAEVAHATAHIAARNAGQAHPEYRQLSGQERARA